VFDDDEARDIGIEIRHFGRFLRLLRVNGAIEIGPFPTHFPRQEIYRSIEQASSAGTTGGASGPRFGSAKGSCESENLPFEQ
jgi:hypothetical protein